MHVLQQVLDGLFHRTSLVFLALIANCLGICLVQGRAEAVPERWSIVFCDEFIETSLHLSFSARER